MSTEIRITKNCEYCGQKFIAKTLVTKYCSHKCNCSHYKQLKREDKISAATKSIKPETISPPSPSIINDKQFLSIQEATLLLGISERTFFRLLKSGTIPAVRLGKRTIIKRSEIDKIFIQ